MAIASVNPATGETLRTFEPHDASEVDRRLALAEREFRTYRKTSFDQRSRLVRALAAEFDKNQEMLARTITLEMGKPITQARAEVAKCAGVLRYYAAHAPHMLSDEPVTSTAAKHGAYLRYEPLGPVLAVMPWNFPLWQVIRFTAPTLMAGNVALCKHASNVPQCALNIEEMGRRAGLPEGVFQTLLIGGDAVEAILQDGRVAAATLTGSDAAGRSVGAAAGGAIKKTVLELGGADPFIVMPSADIAKAAEVGVWARVHDNGQACISAKRFIVHEAIADEYQDLYSKAMARLVVGDPLDEATQLGPLATKTGRDEVAAQVNDAVTKGAEVLCGAEPIEGPGWFFKPTALAGLNGDMRVCREEVFGPVAAFFRCGDIDEAIAIANNSEFGLGSSAWTAVQTEQQRFADELEAGMVFINAMPMSYFDLPFGGIKHSGYGRELTPAGIREFTSLKTVWVD
jgi:succinate-semialdehyde dehydrogenase/glutarate-semialdehyde dehydrogenase